MVNELPPPLPLAMVICDAIWQDPSTGKATLLGLFSEIGARAFPTMHPMLAVHIALTDGQGTMSIKLQLVDVDEELEPLFVVEGQFDFPDPRAIINMNVQMRSISFPTAGEYRLQLFARGEFLLERRLIVRQVGGSRGKRAD